MKYYLVDNPLTEDKTDFRAVPVSGKKRTMQDLVQQIVYRSVGLTDSQISSVLKEFQAATEMYLAEGDTVETDMYTMQPRIRGVFHSVNEGFNRDKHEVYIKVKANGSLKKAHRPTTGRAHHEREADTAARGVPGYGHRGGQRHAYPRRRCPHQRQSPEI